VDNLTHALAGALLGAALPPEHAAADGRDMPYRARAVYCAIVTNLPDLDYLTLVGAAPFEALNLHRGVTHSFLLAPLWGAAIGGLAWWLLRKRFRALELMVLAVAGLLLHGVLDLLTSYGTQIFAPLTSRPFALPLLFIVDPLVWLLLGTGVVLAWRRSSVAVARGGLLALAGYVALCGAFMLRAEQVATAVAEQRGWTRDVVVFPQPLSPLHWKLVVVDGDHYRTTNLGILADPFGGEPPAPLAEDASSLLRLWRSYRSPDALEWTERHRYGADPLMRGFARFAWSREELGGFRRFALLPQLYALGNDGTDAGCGWFTDLRFELPGVANPFVAGICHGPVDGRLSKSSGWRLADGERPPARGK